MNASTASSVVQARGIHKVFEGSSGRHVALENVSLSVQAGEFVALLGPSGCGKSTLLSLLGGFEQPSAGDVLVDGRPLAGPDRRVVTIFQEYGLFPWRSVLGNVEFGLASEGVNRAERREKALHWLQVVGLADFAHAHVSELSGGMRQRVNLARALAVSPEVLLMDEPMGALDAITRARVQEQLRDIAQASDTTIVLVTHDIDEALYLADRIVMMTPCPGRIAEEIRVPLEHPRDRASADFAALRAHLLENLELAHSYQEDYEI